jgi:hypothetical protein
VLVSGAAEYPQETVCRITASAPTASYTRCIHLRPRQEDLQYLV